MDEEPTSGPEFLFDVSHHLQSHYEYGKKKINFSDGDLLGSSLILQWPVVTICQQTDTKEISGTYVCRSETKTVISETYWHTYTNFYYGLVTHWSQAQCIVFTNHRKKQYLLKACFHPHTSREGTGLHFTQTIDQWRQHTSRLLSVEWAEIELGKVLMLTRRLRKAPESSAGVRNAEQCASSALSAWTPFSVCRNTWSLEPQCHRSCVLAKMTHPLCKYRHLFIFK